MSDVVKRDLYGLIDKELEAANQKFPLFNSTHEAFAVILEEAEEAKEEAKEWEESWNMCREQVRALSRQSDIISMVLKMDDVELLDLAFGFVRGCYNQQIKKEQEAENNGEM